ncbi:glycine zipper domain-containing protein [Caballeronia sp. RCC_10]|uniref:glycine zipper domain-containing protein n=1 Tax=Caballeronia sp. RCC_10 TaxID=3239227 RepID=UPI003525D7F6
MNAKTLRASCAIVIAALTLDVMAQGKPIAYPSKGQSAQKQQQDDGACYSWAKSNTGIDPATASTAPPPQSGPAVGGGERVGGAARGAAGGAVIGAIAGDAGKGAAIGATAGTMAGGARARQNRREQQANAQAQSQGAMSTYYRAWAACMQGRGYSIQ